MKSEIRTDWTEFFSGHTNAVQKIALLQDGAALAGPIKSQASSPLGTSAGAKVTSVRLLSASRASVSYSITLGGQTALAHQRGIAMKIDGNWVVGRASFCGLLSLEQIHPAACTAVGS